MKINAWSVPSLILLRVWLCVKEEMEHFVMQMGITLQGFYKESAKVRD